MKKTILSRVVLGVTVLTLLLLFFTKILLEPWITRQAESKIREKLPDYQISIGKIYVSFLRSGLVLENLAIRSKQEQPDHEDLTGEITSVRLNGINTFSLIFSNKIEVHEVVFFNSCLRGKIPFSKKEHAANVSGWNIRIDHLVFNMIELSLETGLSPKYNLIKEGLLNVYDLHISKTDTLSLALLHPFDFEAEELISVPADSLYTFKIKHFNYSETTKRLRADSFLVHPNFRDYEDTGHHKFLAERFELAFGTIEADDFSASDYLKSGILVSSYLRICNLDLAAYCNKRKSLPTEPGLTIQNMIYEYPGAIQIDSLSLLDGNATYTELARHTTEPGRIIFSGISVMVYNISNNPIYKSREAYTKMNIHASLMGKGKFDIQLLNRIFDPQHRFEMKGSLSGMNATELNSMLETNANLQVVSGNIDSLKFNYTADDIRAIGSMALSYSNLKLIEMDGVWDDVHPFNGEQKFIPAGHRVLNSNPVDGKKSRIGIIAFKRNPEKTFTSYCFQTILSGIKSSIIL